MLWRALRGVERGYYVDVGAAEPEADSVTCAFYKRGWRGINFEPAREAFERLSAARPNDINLNIAIGDRNGLTPFYMVDGGNGLSTVVPDQMHTLQEQGWNSTEVHVPVITLASVLAEHLDRTVHFLKIDAEGSERSVLTGADLQHFRPWIILIEATAPNSQVQTHSAWEDLLLAADYRFVWFDGLNRFYVAAEKAELAASFQTQPNVFDNFLRHSEVEAKVLLEQTQISLAEANLREQNITAELAVQSARCNSLIAEAAHLTSTTQANQASVEETVARLETCLAEANLREQQAIVARQATDAELAIQLTRGSELAAQAAIVTAERDAWMQELYEVNRHAAYITQIRQDLTQSCQGLQADVLRLHNLVLAMYSSTSWKFARPVRAISKLLRRR